MLTKQPGVVERESCNPRISGYLERCDGALQRGAVELLYSKECVDLPVHLVTYLYIR